ncbi:MAG: hypothetical protein CMQ25_03200 [Gammaproteobacteria bacterium]|nr:hypothetical protein [Gammaproteobacteria bacterium]
MSKTTNLKSFKKQKLKNRAKAKTLCRSGFHKWIYDQKKQFDVKSGKLISIQKCQRCGTSRTVSS